MYVERTANSQAHCDFLAILADFLYDAALQGFGWDGDCCIAAVNPGVLNVLHNWAKENTRPIAYAVDFHLPSVEHELRNYHGMFR